MPRWHAFLSIVLISGQTHGILVHRNHPLSQGIQKGHTTQPSGVACFDSRCGVSIYQMLGRMLMYLGPGHQYGVVATGVLRLVTALCSPARLTSAAHNACPLRLLILHLCHFCVESKTQVVCHFSPLLAHLLPVHIHIAKDLFVSRRIFIK